MGCDIHLFAEIKPKRSFLDKVLGRKVIWKSIDKFTRNKYYSDGSDYEPEFELTRENAFYSGRNYNLFSALAGVRSYCFIGEPPCISKPKGLPEDCSIEVMRECNRWSSDAHSKSYLTLKEIKDFDWNEYGKTCDEFIEKTIPKLESFNTDPEDIRIVFWFDN